MGLLFLGDAGQGKTNTMLSLTGQILENLEENDLAVIFDLKGDYQEAFYEDGDLILNALDTGSIMIFPVAETTPYPFSPCITAKLS